MKSYLILGGNGPLGVQLTRHLLLNHPHLSVVSVGRHPERPPPFSLHHGIDDSRFEYQKIHIVHEPESLLELIQNRQPEVIVNLAAQAESSASWKNASYFFETNAVALAKIVEPLIGKPWLKKWVQISTSEIYGSLQEPANEETPIRPASPYSASKAAADLYLLSLSNAFGFPVNILRPSSVYGPGQALHRIIPKTVLCALLRRKLPLQGGGKTVKSYLHTDDLSRAITLIAEKGENGKTYHVGPNEGISIRHLVELICERAGASFEEIVELTEGRLGSDTKSLLDCSRISRELGWKPEIDLTKGIDSVIAWAKEYLSFLEKQPMTYTLQA